MGNKNNKKSALPLLIGHVTAFDASARRGTIKYDDGGEKRCSFVLQGLNGDSGAFVTTLAQHFQGKSAEPLPVGFRMNSGRMVVEMGEPPKPEA